MICAFPSCARVQQSVKLDPRMAAPVAKSHYSTLVMGAGTQGIAYARTCLHLDPDVNFLLLDADQSIGGV